jgi:hypothetical protein
VLCCAVSAAAQGTKKGRLADSVNGLSHVAMLLVQNAGETQRHSTCCAVTGSSSSRSCWLGPASMVAFSAVVGSQAEARLPELPLRYVFAWFGVQTFTRSAC